MVGDELERRLSLRFKLREDAVEPAVVDLGRDQLRVDPFANAKLFDRLNITRPRAKRQPVCHLSGVHLKTRRRGRRWGRARTRARRDECQQTYSQDGHKLRWYHSITVVGSGL